MAELPKTVTTLGVEYQVVARKMDQLDGLCGFSSCELTINSDTCDQRQKKTLVHEILHAMLHECGMYEINDEEHVWKLEAALYDLLKNNDFSWLRPSSPGQKSSSGGRGRAR